MKKKEDDDDYVKHPRPVQVVHRNRLTSKLELDSKVLAEIVTANKVGELPAVVVSIAGAFRKGKSFLLNFCIRYLELETSEVKPHQEKSRFWFDYDQPLTGFNWRGGCESETRGILIWSKLYKLTLDTGEQVAVMLMDTEGTFDRKSSVHDCVCVFALSTMMSSLQIYNISQLLREDDLQHLALFTEYGRAAGQITNHKPFQELLFLIRDWPYPYDHPWGRQGGSQLLSDIMNGCENSENEGVRDGIRACYDDISCYLMPHPGLKASTEKFFTGRTSELGMEFREHLRDLIEEIFARDRIKTKKINGRVVKCEELEGYFSSYMDTFSSGELPEPGTLLQATAKVYLLTTLCRCEENYTNTMELLFKRATNHVNPKQLQQTHQRAMDDAMKTFDQSRLMAGENFNEYRSTLESEIGNLYEGFVARNQLLISLTPGFPTALVFLVVGIGFHFLGRLSDLFNLPQVFVCVCSYAVIACFLALMTLLFVSVTGSNEKLKSFLAVVAAVIVTTGFQMTSHRSTKKKAVASTGVKKLEKAKSKFELLTSK